MLNHLKSGFISWILLVGALLLLLEISFFNTGLIFSLLVPAAMIYFGRKMMPKTLGKILFWIGLLFVLTTVFGMMTFRFFLIAILVYLIFQYAQLKKNPQQIRPYVKEHEAAELSEPLIKKTPVLENIFYGSQRTPERVYEWNDVNIQAGFGDTVIDLSYTVLPEGETVIFIRNVMGNIQILVPYDLEVSLKHSVIAGTTTVFDEHEPKVFNQVLSYQTPGYDQADEKIKIFTSLVVGDLEVKRV